MSDKIPTHSASPAATPNALEAVLQQVLHEIQCRAFPGGLSHSDILLNAEAMDTNWGRNLLLSYCMRFIQIMTEDERFNRHGWLMLSNGMGAC
ncbi:hypothetical protein [Polaromonas sp. YR568]|uniref:hypothetical protein n=1 Tax=Polaromonas sp. YR568 TaxID=1855301 RepID=UPI00398BBE10